MYLFYIWDLAAVEFDAGFAHAEIEHPVPHVVLNLPVVEQLADVVLKIRADQTKRVLRQWSSLVVDEVLELVVDHLACLVGPDELGGVEHEREAVSLSVCVLSKALVSGSMYA